MTLYIAFTFLLAGFVKGVIGMGLPTVAVGLLGILMPPAAAAALMVAPSFVTNVWQACAGPLLLPLLRRLGGLLAGVCGGLWAMAWWAPAIDDRHATAALGAILIAYVAFGRIRLAVTIAPAAERWLSPLVGLVTGAITAVTGVFVVPAVPYLQRLGLDRNALVQALGLTFLTATVALGAALPAAMHRLLTEAWATLALSLVAALIGMVMGQWVRSRISLAAFHACFFWGMLALGVHLVVRGWLG